MGGTASRAQQARDAADIMLADLVTCTADAKSAVKKDADDFRERPAEARPWRNFHGTKDAMFKALSIAKTVAATRGPEGLDERWQRHALFKALDAATVGMDWGSKALDMQAVHRATAIIEQLRGRIRISRPVQSQCDYNKKYVAGFHKAVETMCVLAYSVTSDADSATVNIPVVRWHVATLFTNDHPRDAPTHPNLVHVTEITDEDLVTRAFVCVSYDLEEVGGPSTGDADPGESGRVAGGAGAEPASPTGPGVKHATVTCAEKPGRLSVSGRKCHPEPHAIRRRTFDVMRDDAPLGTEWVARDAVIVFTGTESPSLFWRKHVWTGFTMSDFTWAAELDPARDGLEGKAHGAWLHMARHMHPKIEAALKDKSGSLEYLERGSVWILGHSLGAALATLAAPVVYRLREEPVSVFVSTLASPRVFDAVAAKNFENLDRVQVQRFTLPEDPVPWLPFEGMGYRHVGYSRKLRNPSFVRHDWMLPLRPLNSHLASTYRKTLQEFAYADVYEHDEPRA